MSFRDHFSSDSAGYARFRPGYPEALFSFLGGLPRRRSLAWDCATGSGQAASPLLGHFARVVGSDASLAQIAQGARHERLSYLGCLAEASGLATASVDLVTVAQALHWLDLDRFWREVRRVAAPGGVVAVWCLLLARVAPAVDRVVDRFYAETVGPYWPPERCWVERGYEGLRFPFEPIDAPEFEVVGAWDLDRYVGYISTWSATARYREAVGEDPTAALANQLGGVWGDRRAVRRVVWPMRLRAGRVK